MTTRTITANTVDILGEVRAGAVYTFRLLSSIATDDTPSIIPTDDVQSMTSDVAGDSSIALIVPVSGAFEYECKLPDGRLFSFGLEAGAAVDLSDLIADANLDAVTVAGQIATLLGGYVPHSLADEKGDILAAPAANTFSRLAVGTDGQVLTASSGEATGLAWAAAAAGDIGLSVTAEQISGVFTEFTITFDDSLPYTMFFAYWSSVEGGNPGPDSPNQGFSGAAGFAFFSYLDVEEFTMVFACESGAVITWGNNTDLTLWWNIYPFAGSASDSAQATFTAPPPP